MPFETEKNMSSPAALAGDSTLGALLRGTASRHPDLTALSHKPSGTSMTWLEVDQEVDRVARVLLGLGMRKGDRMAVFGLTLPRWIIHCWAALRIGVVAVPVSSCSRPADLVSALVRSRAKVLCVAAGQTGVSLRSSTQQILGEAGLAEGRVHVSDLPDLKAVICADGLIPGAYGPEGYDAIASTVDEGLLERMEADVKPDDIALLMFTSGSTAMPKKVLLRQGAVARNGSHCGEDLKLTPEDKILLPIPLFHCFGLICGVVAGISRGTCMLLDEQFSPSRIFSEVRSERCTCLYGVPGMFRMLLRSRALAKADLTSLRCGIAAGALCPPDLMRGIVDKLHCPGMTIAYGMTEASPTITHTLPEDTFEQRTESVGRPLPGLEVAIFDPETGLRLPDGEQGEICARGWTVMAGYDDGEEATAKIIDKDGWLHTGDLGVILAGGFVAMRGRIKDIIIRCGENIAPSEVEDILITCPGVVDVHVVGVPSESSGEEVAAFLVSDGETTLTAENLRSFCMAHMSSHKVPRHFARVNEYPKIASGKVDLRTLRVIAREFFCTDDARQRGEIPLCEAACPGGCPVK